jgi:hypothetical protein
MLPPSLHYTHLLMSYCVSLHNPSRFWFQFSGPIVMYPQRPTKKYCGQVLNTMCNKRFENFECASSEFHALKQKGHVGTLE